MKEWHPHRWLGPVLLVLILAGSSAAVASNPGVSAGDTVSYTFNRTTSYPTPNGFHVNSSDNAFTVQILSVDNSKPPGQMGILETFSEYQNKTVTSNNTASVITPFFDPYDNASYVGALGFFPFTYTDVQAGSARLQFGLPVANSSSSINEAHDVNVTVTRTASTIVVNFTEKSGALPPSYNYIVYRSSDGVMTFGETKGTLFGETTVFDYYFVSLTKSTAPSNLPLLGYVFIGAFVAVGLFAVGSWMRGRMKPKRREFKPGRGR
jgi:hypothetical protein